MKKISVLIFDLDGTAVQSTRESLPTQRVVDAINKAREYVKASCATGRTIKSARDIIQTLELTSPCILSGGSQILDPISFLPIWEVVLEKDKIAEILEVVKSYNYLVKGSTEVEKVGAKDYQIQSDHPTFYISGISMDQLQTILPLLKQISDITVHFTPGWNVGEMSIQITHKNASKKHALEKWLEIENISSEHVMAIGDANNDLPLFQIAGTKVAMGNAVDELKAEADWIAPSVDEDGLAVAIEKFILS